ncbi:MAG: C25 family cysteine peptidase, partial [Candidatus Omnitrophica bacterium]|nr:C25 family cysteine peptidase [Candidatus Omnitrophota bacterium]
TNPVTEEVYLYKRIRVKLTTQNTSGEAALISPGSGVPQGTASAYKIAVTADGVYRLSYDNLTAAGMDAGDVAPESFKLYNKGNELAVSVSGSTDGSFDAGDYLEFWGRKENTRYTYTNVYWLTFGGTGGERMENTSAQGGAVQEGFLHPHHHESNDFYWSEFRNAGDPWYLWPFVQAGNTESFTVTLQDVLNSERMGVFTGSFRGYSRYDVPSFHARLYINDYLIDDVSWQGNDTYNATVQIPSYWLSEGPNTVKVEHVLDNPAEPLSWVFADWFDISYWRNLTAQADYLLLGASGAGTYAFTVGNFSDSDISVYDVSNATGVRRVVNTTVAPDGLNYQVSFNASASAGGKYALVSQGGIRYPVQILADTPSDLQNASNQADYIIITYDDFHDAVRPLAEHRRDAGLSVIVANISDVYDEFNYGISSPEAIKSFLEYAYTSWQDPAPTYVLLVGDGTYDYRNDEGWGFTDYLPSYLIYNEEFGETSTDDWFVCFDGEDDLLSDMLIGRFPAKSRAEAAQMVNKTIAYESRDISADWTKNMLFVSDDEASFEAINNRLRNETSGDYTSSGIYLSRYGNPLDARAEVIQGISNGSLMVTYSGHGGIQIWADEEMLRVEDVDSLTNSGKYPLMVMLNCVNGHFIQPMFFECLGEELLRPEERGAAAVFAPSGMSLPEHQSILAEGLYDSLFKKEERILGSAVAEAKMYLFQEAGTAVGDVLQSFILFGDPALILRKPALPGAPDAGDPGVFTSVGDTILPLSTFSVSQDATMTLPALLFEGQGDLRQDTAGGALMPPEEGTVSGQGLQRVAERLQAGAPEETGPGGGLQETQPVTQLVVPLSPSGKAPGAKGVVLPKKTGTVGLIPRMMRRQTRSL